MESQKRLKWRKPDLKPVQTGRVNKNTEEIAEEEPLSPAARLFHEPNFNVYVLAIMGCKTRIHPRVIKANLVHTLLKHPRFSSLQVLFSMNYFRLQIIISNTKFQAIFMIFFSSALIIYVEK